MSSQLKQAFRGSSSLSISRRRALVVATSILVAGGGIAYAYTSVRRRDEASVNKIGVHPFGGSGSQKEDNFQSARKRKRKSGGLKSVRRLVGILVAQSGIKGLKYFVSLVTIAVLRTTVSNRLARIQGYLFRAAFLRRVPLFVRLMSENLFLGLFQSVLFSTIKFLTGGLGLHFRKVLTQRIHADYFQNMTYYKISYVDGRINTPEQRIASDVPKFCSEFCELLQENVSAIFDGLLYTWQLCSYASPKYALGILGYVIGAGAITGVLSPPFGRLMSTEQQLEGDYRQLHSRIRTHSESIAFYGGQDREASIIKQRFKVLYKHLGAVLYTQWWFGIIQDFLLKYLGATFGVVLIIGPFFSGNLKPENSTVGRAKMLSNMRYHTSVIISLFISMGTLAASTRRFARLSGYADRVSELLSVVRELRVSGANCAIQNPETGSYFVEANYIGFEGVKVVTPTGAILVEDLTLKVEPGSNLLITGPNGSGKSSLFRVLGGLWPLVAGCIAKPGVGSGLNHEIFYVPQRPYTSFGTLPDQLIYPLTASDETEPLTYETARELLKNVDLEYLLDRYPPNQEVNWGDELSLGEQQRLGMARLFYHKPTFAILDECTSAVTTDMEERFCAQVRAMGTSCVTISHRPALVAFHDTVLALDGEGGWSVHYKRDNLSQPSISRSIESKATGPISDRKNDALVLQNLFSSFTKDDSRQGENSSNGYARVVIANSPPADPYEQIPAVPRLQSEPRKVSARVSALLRVLVPNFSDRQGTQIFAVALLVVGRTWISDHIADLNGLSVRYVLEQDVAAFIRLTGVSVMQSAASSIVAPSLRYLTAKLSLSWRNQLTEYLSKLYFSNNAFYKAVHLSGGMDSDQRLTQDVEKLCSDLAGLVTGMVKPLVDILWFTFRMELLTGKQGVIILYAYMLLGLGCLRAITPNFASLKMKEQQLEGSFRYMHSRLRTHAESVAFFGGGSREQAVVESQFKSLLSHCQKVLRKRWYFGIADEFITKQFPHNVTWFLSIIYALEHHGTNNKIVQGELAHDLRFLASVVSQSFLAFGDILELYRKFLELSGGITRVMELDEALSAAQQDTKPTTVAPTPDPLKLIEHSRGSFQTLMLENVDDIVFSEVDIVTPSQKMLARKLTFRVQPGQSMLVTGPNGSGKSSLFRVLGGLWPLVSGRISKPGRVITNGQMGVQICTGLSREIFYVPQRPYTALGTLRDQIIYPLTLMEATIKVSQELGSPETFEDSKERTLSGCASEDAVKALDVKLQGILEDVRLVYLLEREGGWNTAANWEDMLSLGEQQRLGMARLFFHHPKYGILDECTNATSIDVEEGLYKKAEELGITVVTISQRPGLLPYHSTELRLIDGEGAWEVRLLK